MAPNYMKFILKYSAFIGQYWGVKFTTAGVPIHFYKHSLLGENPTTMLSLIPARPSVFKILQLIHFISKSHEIYLKMFLFLKLKLQNQSHKIWT